MATTQEILIKYKADVSELQGKVATIEASLRKVDTAFAASQKNIQTAQAKTTQGLEGLRKAVAPIAGLIASAFATHQLVEFAAESVRAFQAAELNAKKLQAAVSANGGLQADFDTLIKQSKELQETTIFSNADVQKAQTLALQFGLTSDAVEQLMPLITDFASATGQDLTTALSAVLRGVEGNEKALKVYGVQIDSAANRSDTFARITEQLSNKFKGQAAILGNTTSGSLAKLSNAFEEIKERIGGFLAPAVAGFAKLAQSAVDFTKVPLSKTLEEERVEFEKIQIRLHDVNLSHEDRVKLIAELQSKYPDYLANINAETVNNKDLFAALKNVNEQLINKILIQKEDEKIAKQAEATAEKRAALFEIEDKLIASIAEAHDKYNFQLQEGLSITEQAAAATKFLEETQGRVGTSYNRARSTITDLNIALSQHSAATSIVNIEERKGNLLVDEKNKLLDRLGIKLDSIDKKEPIKTGLEGETDEERRKREKEEAQARQKALDDEKKFLEAQAALREQLRKIQEDAARKAIEDEFEARRQAERDGFADSIKIIEKGVADGLIKREEGARNILQLEQSLQESLTGIDQDEAKKRFELQQKANKDAAEKAFDLSMAQLEVQQAEAERFENEAFANQADKSEQAEAEHQKRLLDIDIKFLKLRAAANEDDPIAQAKILKQIKDLESKKLGIITDSAGKQKLTTQELIQNIQQAYDALASNLEKISNGITQNQIDNLNAQQEARNEAFDAEQEAIEKGAEKRLITEAQAENQSAELKKKRAESEKLAAEQVNAVKRKQAEIDKLLSIFRIGLILAEAIADLNFFKAGVAAAELIAVVATPIPKFKKGTPWLERGQNPQGTDTIPIYANEGERIVPTEQNLKHWDLYEAIDKNKQDQYIMKRYVVPILEQQSRKKQDEKQEDFAGSIAKNIQFNGMSFYDHDYLRRKGIKFAPGESKRHAKEVAQEVAKEVVRAMIREGGR